ncbi:MAG TPA: DNA polymerase I [Candidatus Deferrimicrobiaceae bacterium]|nr:DNA polymerase I [Candidatus Deferrimicrobiaceae bacterium]
MTSLYLIDGHNVLYRTFYGLPRLTAPDGTPTNVVLGTVRILLKILREESPDAVAAVFDSPEPTPRHDLFPESKANRLKVPEELLAQVPLVKEAIDALGVARIEVSGAEADDIIGTLARIAEERGMEVVIISSDKDLYQLVSKKVRVRDGLKERTVGAEEVREAFGVGPDQVAELIALAGDPSDNVPGVPGIGEKTASGLIREFGTVENLLAHTDRLKGKQREKIEKNAEMARLCRKLATIDRNVPLRQRIEDLKPRGIHREKVAALFRRLGFRKLLEDLELPPAELPPPGPGKRPPREWTRGKGADDLIGAIGDIPPSRVGVAASGEEEGETAAAVPGRGIWFLPAPAASDLVRRVGESGGTVFLHDGKSFLRRHGDVSLPDEGGVLFDLQIGAYLLAPEEGTPTLAKIRDRFLPGQGPPGQGEEGLAAQAEEVAVLGRILEEKLAEAGLTEIFRKVDMPLLPVLFRMEKRGIRIDPGIFGELSEELAEATREIEERVAAIAGPEFNINSPKQLSFLLFEKLGLPPVKRTKTGYSTDVEVLEQLKGAHEIPALVLEYRTLAKIRSTYVDVLPGMVDPGDGRIHTTFHQTQTATGRLSSSDPNLQNIPVRADLGRRIRSGFVADPGWLFVGADYSQVELRLLAHLSGDAELTRRFREGEDIHIATACAVFGVDPSGVTPELRRRAKVINFGILYGMSPFGLSRELGIGGKEAKQYIDQYFRRYPGVDRYIEGLKEQARKDGSVHTILGRRRFLRDINSQNRVLREAAERMAINTPIQGSAADIIKMAMIRVDREFRERRMRAGLVLQIHDELIAECPETEAGEAERILKGAMEGVVSLSVPLTVSVSRGKHWGEVH